MGGKYIKIFASGIAHMFACSAQRYAWLAYQYRVLTVTIDLWEMRTVPAEFDIERNRILAGMCKITALPKCQAINTTYHGGYGSSLCLFRD